MSEVLKQCEGCVIAEWFGEGSCASCSRRYEDKMFSIAPGYEVKAAKNVNPSEWPYNLYRAVFDKEKDQTSYPEALTPMAVGVAAESLSSHEIIAMYDRFRNNKSDEEIARYAQCSVEEAAAFAASAVEKLREPQRAVYLKLGAEYKPVDDKKGDKQSKSPERKQRRRITESVAPDAPVEQLTAASPIEELGLDARTHKLAKSDGRKTIADLIGMDSEQFHSVKGMDDASYGEIVGKLRHFGFDLRQPVK